MGHIGISITKRTAFRDSVQEFSNVYYYKAADNDPGPETAEGFIDEIVAWEKSVHATVVTFVRAKCWSAGGTISQNKMIFQKALSGTGGGSADSTQDRERAFLIQWSAGVDSRGRPVKLKKWFHTAGGFGLNVPAPQSPISTNTGSFSSATRTAIANEADSITRIGALEAWGLCGPTGRDRDVGKAPVAHKYFEHHQLGDQWRS